MHEVIICEKPKSSEKIAQAISPNASEKKYKKISYWEIEENGKKITVLSAVGHLFTLKPKNSKEKYLFDLEWVPLYDVDKKKGYIKDYVTAIKKFAKNADSYIHACDYDIEGTLIGYNTLKYICGDDSIDKTSRMKFSTLTKEDVLKAYENPIELDINQVDGGIARHTLDYIFGVNISKSLMKSVTDSTKKFIKLSAGRVQTPSLAILVEREREINKFIPEPYWLIKAKLEKDIKADHKKGKIFDKTEAEKILKKCEGEDAVVDKITIRENKKVPPIPFNLSGLQSEAYAVFGFSPKKTQQLAQNLYTEGYISYPRTSSQKIPKSLGVEKILKKLSNKGEFKRKIDTLPKKLKANEGKKTDAAHPSIHPTGILPAKLNQDEEKIYNLIVYRFISVFGEDAKIETMKTILKIANEEFNFSRKRISFIGWLNLYPYKKLEDEEFPNLKKGDKLKVEKIIKEEKETKAPPRYNEASLVKELEKRGLGTKTTRADIVAKLYDRKYIQGKKKIEVNKFGEKIIDTVEEYCNDLTSEELTQKFEKELDEILSGETKKDLVIEDAEENVVGILDDIEKNKKNIGKSLYEAYQESRIVTECDCGGNLVIKYSPKNKSTFVGCSNYPECKVTYSLPRNATILKDKCEKCGLPMIAYGNKKQRRVACLDSNCGKEKQTEEVEYVGKCPECGKNLIIRSGRYGDFAGCEGFPKCRFTVSLNELDNINKEPKK